MSAGGAFGGARGYQPKAPEKGVFPLDHFGECKAVACLSGQRAKRKSGMHDLGRSGGRRSFMMMRDGLSLSPRSPCSYLNAHVKQEYVECLDAAKGRADACRDLAKKYLECRMARNLMAKQDLAELGFKEGADAKDSLEQTVEEGASASENEERRKKGFVAGIRRS